MLVSVGGTNRDLDFGSVASNNIFPVKKWLWRFSPEPGPIFKSDFDFNSCG